MRNARRTGLGTAALTAALIFAVAVVWRGFMASNMPCLSRDGVTFCWYARALEQHGAEYLRRASTQQHPLFPTAILAIRRAALRCGVDDGPLLWQRCGQFVSFVSGLAVVALCGSLGAKLARASLHTLDARLAGCMSMALAAILPLNIELSADVLSDSLHLAFYLIGALMLTQIDRPLMAAMGGLAGGFAFATRPEGAIAIVGAAVTWGAAVWQTRSDPRDMQRRSRRRLALSGVMLGVGFAVVALPFWSLMGRFAPKKDPAEFLATIMQQDSRDGDRDRVELSLNEHPIPLIAQARLLTFDLNWYQIPFFVAYMTFRAGRVVVTLLGLAQVASLRRSLLRPAWIGMATCFILHAALLCLLLHRWRYLAPRHALVLVALLTPAAGILLARGWQLAPRAAIAMLHRLERRPKALRGARRIISATLRLSMTSAVAIPLAIYAVRVPNGDEGHMARAAAWLRANDPAVGAKLLTGDNAEKRIAFYADMAWDSWLEDPRDWERIRSRTLEVRPAYFALESGRDGEAELMQALLSDSEIGPRMRQVYETDAGRGGRLHLFSLAW